MSIKSVISIYPVSNGQIQDHINVSATLSNNGYEKINFSAKGLVHELSAKDIQEHPIQALSKFATSLSNDYAIEFTEHEIYGSELVFTIDDYNDLQLMLPSNGMYARFTQHGVETYYWDAREFFEATSDVLGAILGILVKFGDIH